MLYYANQMFCLICIDYLSFGYKLLLTLLQLLSLKFKKKRDRIHGILKITCLQLFHIAIYLLLRCKGAKYLSSINSISR